MSAKFVPSLLLVIAVLLTMVMSAIGPAVPSSFAQSEGPQGSKVIVTEFDPGGEYRIGRWTGEGFEVLDPDTGEVIENVKALCVGYYKASPTGEVVSPVAAENLDTTAIAIGAEAGLSMRQLQELAWSVDGEKKSDDPLVEQVAREARDRYNAGERHGGYVLDTGDDNQQLLVVIEETPVPPETPPATATPETPVTETPVIPPTATAVRPTPTPKPGPPDLSVPGGACLNSDQLNVWLRKESDANYGTVGYSAPNSQGWVYFNLSDARPVRVKVTDNQGAVVRTCDGAEETGLHKPRLDHADKDGGRYFFTEEFHEYDCRCVPPTPVATEVPQFLPETGADNSLDLVLKIYWPVVLLLGGLLFISATKCWLLWHEEVTKQ